MRGDFATRYRRPRMSHRSIRATTSGPRPWLLLRPIPHPQRPKAQRVEADKTFGVLLVVGALVVLEGDERRGVERLRAFAAGDDDIAFVEREPHLALDMLLALIDEGLEHVTLRREPEAVVD